MEHPIQSAQAGGDEAGRISAAAIAAAAAFLILPFGGMSIIFVLHQMLKTV